MSETRRQIEAMLFKPVAGAFIYRAPNPWIFGRADHYIVDAQQKAELLDMLAARSPMLSLAVFVAGVLLWGAAIGTLRWALSGHDDPTVGIETPRVPIRRGRTIGKQAIRAFLDAPGRARCRVQAYLFVFTAARLASVAGLRWADVDFDEEVIHFNAKFDALGALDSWVDRGQVPQTLIGTDANPANKNRTRPLCLYPAWPKYVGAGDQNDAKNFVCTAP